MYTIIANSTITKKDYTYLGLGDYKELCFSLPVKETTTTIYCSFKISNTFLATHQINQYVLEEILKEKFISYLKSNDWMVDTLQINTKTICTGPAGEGTIGVYTIDQLRGLRLEDIITYI